jgi:Sulfotransferase family
MADTVITTLTEESLLNEAKRQSGLSDFGDLWFLEPMGKLLESIHNEAKLSPAGVAGQGARIVHGLVSRLRLQDALKRNPEILDEKVTVAGTIVGLPRTGSTMFHRMLSNAPGINSIKWFETQFYAPFAGEERGNPVERRALATKVMEGYVAAGMMSIHPFAIDAPDEEIIIMDQFFVGTMPESAMYVPSYSEWLGTFDHTKAYEDLKTVLKFFQWQDVGRQGKRWVLKTPGHLPTLDTLFKVFPETTVITTHRDPISTVPSYCSMTNSLVHMNSNQVDDVEFGRFTEKRWAGFLERYEAARQRIGAHRFVDIKYEDLVKAPLDQARPVLAKLGVEMTPEVEDGMKEWLQENARDKRAAHHYTLEQFGLSEAELEKDFKSYRERFIL